MMNDPIVSALKDSGIDPSPAFAADLESLLARAYDGEQIPTAAVLPNRRDAPWRHILVSAAAAAVLLAAAVGGVIALRDDSQRKTIVNAPTPATDGTPETDPSIAPSTTVSPAPTTAVPQSVVATIDLSAAVPRLEPTKIASFPIAPPGDLYPTAAATPAGGDRIALLDFVTGVVRFIDATTSVELTQYPTDVPTIGSPSFVNGYFFVGPGDVLYVNDIDGALVAHGHTGNSYVEIARVPHVIGDAALALGRTGISVTGALDAPIVMPYVGIDGRPSGATLDIDNLTITSDTKDVYTLGRDDRSWTVTYIFPPDSGLPQSDVCVLCPNAYLGPDNAVVLIIRSPTPDGDLQTKLTMLGDEITTYDTDWNYIGTQGGKMLFDRLDQDSIDIGTFDI